MQRKDRVLVVEDDDGLREAIAAVLEEAGLEVTAVAEVPAAITRLRLGGIGLVFLDLGLTVLSGRAFMDAYHRDPSLCVVPVVLVSGEPDLARVARRLGAVGYIRKPFDAGKLLDAVDRWMPSARSRSA